MVDNLKTVGKLIVTKLVAVFPRIWCQKNTTPPCFSCSHDAIFKMNQLKSFCFQLQICQQKMCHFHVSPIHQIVHHFQIVPVSCTRSLKSFCLRLIQLFEGKGFLHNSSCSMVLAFFEESKPCKLNLHRKVRALKCLEFIVNKYPQSIKKGAPSLKKYQGTFHKIKETWKP